MGLMVSPSELAGESGGGNTSYWSLKGKHKQTQTKQHAGITPAGTDNA